MTLILNEIREQIDSIDNQIHDLIMRRAALARDILKEKAAKNLPIVQPAREVQLIRRLTKRHQGDFPVQALAGIWREMISAICTMQTDIKISVASDDGDHTLMLAGQYFGNSITITKAQSDLMAVAALRNQETTFSVVPWPAHGVDDSHEKTWWEHAFMAGHGDEAVYIIGALPFVYNTQSAVNGFAGVENKVMILGRDSFQSSGDDHTCFVLRIDHSVSRGRIVDVCEQNGLTPVSLHTKTDGHFENTSLHMVIVEGYHHGKAELIDAVTHAFAEDNCVFKSVGGYAVPHGV